MKKKHKSILPVILIIVLVCVGGIFLVGLLSGSDETENKTGNETENETEKGISDDTETGSGSGSVPLKDMVAELSKGGKSLAPDYEGGEYGIWGTESSVQGLRDYYTDTQKAGSVTWMVYMVGADLESKSGAATADLHEMIDSGNGDSLKIVVQTGGASSWDDSRISADTRGRWLIENHDMQSVGDAGQGSMCTRQALADFITWAKETYPSDRYVLELWDHGGGTMGGFGCDENYPEDTLTLADLSGAVADSGIKLDIMSFDACLMGTLETAYAFEPYADYLLASEETEPGEGWAYTDTMAALSEKPSMPTTELGARMIDAYGAFYGNDDVTLSLMDLREIPNLYNAYTSYAQNAKDYIASDAGFKEVSKARENSRSYADGGDEQIDLADYISRTSVNGGEDLLKMLFSAVKYRNDSDLSGSYGIAVYFPYEQPEMYQDVREGLKSIKCTGAEPFYDDFLSVMASGSGGNTDTLTQLTGYNESSDDLSGADWYSDNSQESYSYDTLGSDEDLKLDYDDKEQAYTLSLSDDVWDQLADIQLQVYLDDGEGYIDLGSDQMADFTDSGALKVDFDNTWTAINGQPVAFYAFAPETRGDTTIFSGTVPAMLNDSEEIDVYLQWVQDESGNTTASVLGYLPYQEDGDVLAKGYFELRNGDVLQPICDYYTYDGNFDSSYTFGDAITVDSQDALTVDTADLNDAKSCIWLKLTDLYQQDWYTEQVEISYK
ncbi:MAG TPA: clostripain-related cysteine peptidase [Lachnospiraceae bacterium]|nr:clostripain-related cysteine peptidase [Lachnospiraceae bacterium]